MSPTAAERESWPRLSISLSGPREPHCCQSCGQTGEVQRWQECNGWDQLEKVLVLLCDTCAKRLINPHPRLYIATHSMQPWPGAMDLCVGCVFRHELNCTSPLLKENGGTGLEVKYPEPTVAHVCRSPRSRSGFTTMWNGHPSACAGRKEVAE